MQESNGDIVLPTSFPDPVNYGMTWNRTSFLEMGQLIATETRALWLAGATEFSGWSGYPHIGLDLWVGLLFAFLTAGSFTRKKGLY